ncbi:O-antigen ligase family protein [Xanthocytophaga agilis]|uniref:O-antigen ligase family protein n=1 Tax=Xanthocytophaga agilis TaxID=3048010 RepID=A0AAE3R7D7_9BACT|nr:O-antigen ligase family protein [Xanthocytophaga agilis]MDJ1505109.1 O-antigen ligase family protein [Xanthocytophaga agilis]
MEAFLGENALTNLLPLAVLGLGVGHFAFIEKQQLYIGTHWNKKNLAVYFLSFLTFVIAVARINSEAITGGLGIITMLLKYTLFPVFVYLFISYQFRNNDGFEKNVQRVLYVLFLTIALEAAFYFILFVMFFNQAAVNSEEGAESHLMLSLIGIHTEKRLLPIINVHPNTMGIYTGGVLVMAFLLVKQKGIGAKLKKLLYIFIGIGILFLLMVDSRGTIINTLMATLGVFLLSRTRFLGLLRIMPVLSPLLPFIMLSVLAFISETGLGSQVSRQEGDLATGNNRSAIWEECMKELSDPKFQHFIGYGEMGQAASGVSKRYAWIFGSGEVAESMVTHNYFFQMVFDMGYIGTFIFFVFMFVILGNAISAFRQGFSRALAVIGFLTYFMLSGTSESIYGIYNKNYFMVFTVVVLFMAISYNEFMRYKREKVTA